MCGLVPCLKTEPSHYDTSRPHALSQIYSFISLRYRVFIYVLKYGTYPRYSQSLPYSLYEIMFWYADSNLVSHITLPPVSMLTPTVEQPASYASHPPLLPSPVLIRDYYSVRPLWESHSTGYWNILLNHRDKWRPVTWTLRSIESSSVQFWGVSWG